MAKPVPDTGPDEQPEDPLASNSILAELSEDQRHRLFSAGRIFNAPRSLVVMEPGKRVAKVYFPLESVCSVVTVMRNGTGVEAVMIGREGVTAIPVILGEERVGRMRAFMQLGGPTFEIDVNALGELMSPEVQETLRRFILASFMQASQSAACNRLHSIEQRCARWLLMARERVDRDTIELTQEFLAEMLGIRRPSVTVAAGILQKAGFIEYHRGQMTILDRDGLETASCECFAVLRDEYARLGVSPRR